MRRLERADVDARLCQAGAQPAREGVGARSVAVHADRVDVHRQRRAGGGQDHAVADHLDGAGDDDVGVVDHGARPRPRRQRAVRLVGAVREAFRRDVQTRGAAGLEQLRSRQPEHHERSVEGGDRAGDGVGECAVSARHGGDRLMIIA